MTRKKVNDKAPPFWAVLQGTVSTVHAAQTAPQPISFTATVGVGMVNDIREDAVIITTDTKEE